MKMKAPRRSGFVLVLVIIAIAVIGIHMFVLAGMSNTMMFQSHSAYLRACERNLLASGVAWAGQNVENRSGAISDETIQLDVSKMGIRNSALDVTITVQPGEEAEVQIKTLCSRARQTSKGEGTYRIKLNDQQKTTLGARKGSAGD